MTTGEAVVRERMLPGAVLARVAASHIRVGTFEFFATRGDVEGTRLLADYVIARLYPEAGKAERPYHALLDAVIERIPRGRSPGVMAGRRELGGTELSGAVWPGAGLGLPPLP